jgi:hypothetical protein
LRTKGKKRNGLRLGAIATIIVVTIY